MSSTPFCLSARALRASFRHVSRSCWVLPSSVLAIQARTFGAMRHPRVEHPARRHRCVTLETEIDRQPVEKVLDLLRGVEPCERPMLCRRQQRMKPASIAGHQGTEASRVNVTSGVLHTSGRDSSATGVLHSATPKGNFFTFRGHRKRICSYFPVLIAVSQNNLLLMGS